MDDPEQTTGSMEGQVYVDDSGNLRRTQRCSSAPTTWIDHIIAYLLGPGAMQMWKRVTPQWNEIRYAEYKSNDV